MPVSTGACFGIFISFFFSLLDVSLTIVGKKKENYVCEYLCMMNQVSRLCNYSAFELLLPLHWVFEFSTLKYCVFGAACLDEWQQEE